MDLHQDNSSTHLLRIAVCPPQYQQLIQVVRGESADATHIIQRYIAEGLQVRGHSLTFIAPRDSEIVCTGDLLKPELAPRTWSSSHLFDISANATWRIQRCIGMPYLNIFSNLRLLDACLQCLPGHDLVYERNSLYRYGVAMACKRLKLPYVLYFEADDIMEQDYIGKPITGLLRWCAKKAIRFNLDSADCVICVSNQSKLYLIKEWKVSEGKIVVFPNAADINRFRPDQDVRSEIRTTLGINKHLLIIFIGSFYRWHDVSTLLNAFAQLASDCPNARMVLVGDGVQRQEMMRLVNELNIRDVVQFTGLVAHDSIPRFLSAADIAVVPYPLMKQEMWFSPIKLFEYMASGLAVVASKVGQLNEVIKDGYNGLLVPPGDTMAITSALKRLIEDKNLRLQLGQHAREDAVKKYSWEHYIMRLERVCEAVIAGISTDLI